MLKDFDFSMKSVVPERYKILINTSCLKLLSFPLVTESKDLQ